MEQNHASLATTVSLCGGLVLFFKLLHFRTMLRILSSGVTPIACILATTKELNSLFAVHDKPFAPRKTCNMYRPQTVRVIQLQMYITSQLLYHCIRSQVITPKIVLSARTLCKNRSCAVILKGARI
jgi:hypothetical protein